LPDGERGFGIIKASGNNQTTALIKGNYVLTRTPDERFVLSTYTLYPRPYSQPVDDPVKTAELSKEHLSYIQTAMTRRYENRTGMP
jgi:hypothetical protein